MVSSTGLLHSGRRPPRLRQVGAPAPPSGSAGAGPLGYAGTFVQPRRWPLEDEFDMDAGSVRTRPQSLPRPGAARSAFNSAVKEMKSVQTPACVDIPSDRAMRLEAACAHEVTHFARAGTRLARLSPGFQHPSAAFPPLFLPPRPICISRNSNSRNGTGTTGKPDIGSTTRGPRIIVWQALLSPSR